MKRLIEILAFVALAIGVHLSLLLRFDNSDGAESGGQGGDAMVSFAAATASVETMVKDWEAPPETTLSALPPTTPSATQTETAPIRAETRPELARAPLAAISLPSAPVNSPALPEIDLSTPPLPLSEPDTPPKVMPQEDQTAPNNSKRPQLRPEKKPAPKPPSQPAQHPQTAKPATSTRPNSASVKAKTSAGSGGGAQAGISGKSSVKTVSKSQKVKLQTIWGGKIRARIERHKHAHRGGKAKGRVVVRITVARDGRIISARITRSSGKANLDKAIMSAVSRAGRMPRAPKGLEQPSYPFNLVVDF